jgi:hypothetical protein
VFDQLRRAVGDLEAVSRALDPSCLDGRAAAGLVEVAARGERICSAIKALGARRVEETNAWREGGHCSAAHWIADATGETVGAAARALETSRALERLPDTDAAFRAGQLSSKQAAEITSAAGADPAAESALLETAAGTGVKACATGAARCVLARRRMTSRGRVGCTSNAAPTSGPIPMARTASKPDWRRTPVLVSARHGRRTPTASFATPAGPVGVSLTPPTQPTRWSRSLVTARASRSRSAP